MRGIDPLDLFDSTCLLILIFYVLYHLQPAP